MPATSSSQTALVHSSVALNLDILAKYTGAGSIKSFELSKGTWLYLIECPEAKQYDDFNEALIATEIHLKSKCFLPILDDAGRTDGKIILNPPQDPSFRPAWPTSPSELLIPGLKRLSKQLQVDFAINVHGSEGSRKREKVRTIYDEEDKPVQKKKTTKRARTDDHALEAMRRSHAEELAAKDRTIHALKTAMAATSELIKSQAALIAKLTPA